MSDASAIVLGGLGGLGGALVRELALRDLEVILVDNFDPACAPHVHHRYREERLTALGGVSLERLDIRSQALLDLVGKNPSAHIFHCASPNPARPTAADATLSSELTLEVPQRITRLRHKQSVPEAKLILAHWRRLGEEDPRRAFTVWEQQLEFEELARTYADQLEEVIVAELPMLTGAGMNPWLPPLLPARQLVSRIPATIPREEVTAAALPLESAANWLADLALNDSQSPPPGEEKGLCYWPEPYRILAEFCELAEIDLEELRGEVPPWGAPVNGEPPLSEGEAAQQLLADLLALPHSPELDWPISAKKRKRRRNRGP